MPLFGYTSVRDMFDGGGAGQSGSEFGGTFGGVSNSLGFSPVGSDTDRGSGSVYQGPNPNGSAGYRQDPGLMGVDTSTGFITSDANKFTPAPPPPPPPPPPQFDAVAYLAGREDTPPLAGTVPAPAPVAPVEPAAEEEQGFTYSPVPSLALLPASRVGFNPETQFTFEQYLAQLQGAPGGGLVSPPPVAPIALPGMNQGIGSLVQPPVVAPVNINPPPILYFGPDGRPVYGGIA